MSQLNPVLSRPRWLIALSTTVVMAASTLSAPGLAQAAEVPDGDRKIQSAAAKPGRPVPVDRTPLPDDGGRWIPPKDLGWPTAGQVSLAVDDDPRRPARGVAGRLPVTVSAVAGTRAPERTGVRVLDEQHAGRLGVSGPVVVIDGDAGTVRTTLDYAGFRQFYGAGWGERLNLLRLPACAVTSPERAQCRRTERVEATNNTVTSTLSTQVAMSGGESAVFAVTADESSEEGDYTATDLKAAGSWTGGSGSGGFSYSIPVRLPPAEGPLPTVSLGYSSQVVDGRMAGANNQASWAGDGWGYAPGFIERSYTACADDRSKVDDRDPNNKDLSTGDQCWKGTSASISISLNGTSTALLKDDTKGVWRARNDDNWKIELAGSPASAGAATTERWTVTTPDGTRYFFAGEAAANSRWTVPVFGNHSGEACHASTFKGSACQQAWRWWLDKAVDVHGNTVRYTYASELGHYGAAGDANNRLSYTRGGQLTTIEYGLHADYPSVPASAKVVFSTGNRCLVSECHRDGKPVNANWPDVPWDRDCAAAPCTNKQSPVFFSTKRLTKITTQVRSGGSFSNVESWSLDHEFKAPKVAGSASLWLKEVVHAGHVGDTTTEPPIRFTGVELVNRANALAGAALFSRWRIQNIRTSAGADIHVTYSEPDCDTNDVPAKLENNSRRCYPVYWTPAGYLEPKLDWFHKYVVTEVSEIDRTADQPAITTRYQYSTDGGGSTALWAYDDSEFTKKKHRTYQEWRGYPQVTTLVGEPGRGVPLTTRKRFYRGLDGEPMPDGSTRSVRVSDSENNSYPDHRALAGSVLEEAKLDGNTVVEASTSQYWTRETATRAHSGGTDRAYLTGPAVQKTRKLIAPGTWARTETRTGYNNDGLPETVAKLGDTGRPGDETCTRTTYVPNDDRWIREAVSRVETVAKDCGQTTARPDDVVSDVRTYHDGSQVHGAKPTEGLVTREEELDTWEGGPSYAITVQRGHDDLGRVTSETDARGEVTTTAYTPAGPGPVTQTVSTNPLGHQTTTTLQPAWAEPTAVVDANDKRTVLTRDPLGRLAKVWLPGRSATATPNMEFGYLLRTDGPLAVTTKQLTPNGGYRTEVSLLDSLHRSVQTQTDAAGGKRLVTSTGYNDRGLEAYRAGPNHRTGAPGTDLIGDDPGADRVRTTFSHDGVGRVTNEGTWSANKLLWETVTGYGGSTGGWQVTVTPPLGGTATSTISDVHDQKIELRQYHGATPTGDYDKTTYTYTPRGDLDTVTGAQGEIWRYDYDLRGRETANTDPDKGVTKLDYNNADQLISSTNPLGEVVSTEYDDLGREAKRLVDGQLAAEWSYDTVAKGQLTKRVTIVDGHRFTREVAEYDDSYQVADEETVIPAMPGLEGVAGTYVATYTFRPDGSPDRGSLPKIGGLEREVISYTYDDLGRATRVVGTAYPSGTNTVYVDDATWSPYGEVLKRTLGVEDKPQAYQTYVYDDPTRRLTDFYFDRDATVTNVAAVHYGYDRVGNVLSQANVPQQNDGAPRAGASDVQCFQYDGLRRLTQAWTQPVSTCAAEPKAGDVGGVSPYWASYTYHRSGSRDTVTDRRTGAVSSYGYGPADGARPHAVRTVTSGSRVDKYDWDAVGNLERRTYGGVTENLDWNPQGKLTKITGPGGTTRMVYDVDGQRIARIDPGGRATLFVFGHELTVTGGATTATRYYEHGGDTVASRTASTGTATKDVVWLAADHHETALWAVNSVTRVETVRYADPYGARRAGGTGGSWSAGQRGFVGGVEDPNGLALLGARFYDPNLGAFVSVDPLQDTDQPQQWNGYSYANNSPVTLSDPTGLIPLATEGGGAQEDAYWRKNNQRLVLRNNKWTVTSRPKRARTPSPSAGRSPTAPHPPARPKPKDKGDGGKRNSLLGALKGAWLGVAGWQAEQTGAQFRGAAILTGGECAYRHELWVCQQGWLPMKARGGTMYGTTFVTSKNPQSVGTELAMHEKFHRDAQWKRFGPLFGPMYLGAEVTDKWILRQKCNRFEMSAELASDGGGEYHCFS
ncbi:RHS repeat-associated core domain-containing protein [Plantactinospora sp. S1510]|uniref:RHS repeat-associated core domain-containing protein n=1 Tax=Plantactinospora alkalitolerans TaxID=2789879 RepID=A0ABS0GR62_9ACTN|nr:RHS repeat-associated core domain-containing protein [Plantactinospora alkalitolerans]MBF9128549.1 RHS repeat-associated core domain-containing protein [Plantactinospora alkalitolerans]